MEFELSWCVLAEDGEQVEEVVEAQVAWSVAGEHLQDPVTKRIFLSGESRHWGR